MKKKTAYHLALVFLISSPLLMADNFDSSYVDVNPFVVGRQWTYHYDYEYNDRGGGGVIQYESDTGSVVLRVLNELSFADSTRWVILENKTIWYIIDSLPWTTPEIQVDTFQVVELNQGHHQLYRDSCDVRSVFPLFPNFVDTGLVYRYAKVDTNGYYTVRTMTKNRANIFSLAFKHNVGLSAIQMDDGCLCIPWYWTGHSLVSTTVTGVKNTENNLVSRSFNLDQNYPNPFNPSTIITFNLPSSTYVSLKIFDVLGREVETLISQQLGPGRHYEKWNASKLGGGVYFYRLRTETFSQTKKLILLK